MHTKPSVYNDFILRARFLGSAEPHRRNQHRGGPKQRENARKTPDNQKSQKMCIRKYLIDSPNIGAVFTTLTIL